MDEHEISAAWEAAGMPCRELKPCSICGKEDTTTNAVSNTRAMWKWGLFDEFKIDQNIDAKEELKRLVEILENTKNGLEAIDTLYKFHVVGLYGRSERILCGECMDHKMANVYRVFGNGAIFVISNLMVERGIMLGKNTTTGFAWLMDGPDSHNMVEKAWKEKWDEKKIMTRNEWIKDGRKTWHSMMASEVK